MTSDEADRTVLVVEDEEFLRDGIVELLTMRGWEVYAVEDGQEAFDVFRRRPFEVVLTDLLMPRLDGMQLIRSLREIDPEIPLVVLTAFGTSDRLGDALRAGATDFLHKPFDNDELAATLLKAWESRFKSRAPSIVLEKTKAELEVTIPADHEIAAGAIAEIEIVTRAFGYYKKRWNIRRALEEAVENAVTYGSENRKPRNITLSMNFDGEALSLSVADQGPGFDWKKWSVPDGSPTDERGLFFIRSVADETTWNEEGNVITMTFYRVGRRFTTS